MGLIVHHDGWFFEWDSRSEKATTAAMTRDEMVAHVRARDGVDGLLALPERLRRAEENGSSSMHNETARDVVARNSMGPNETRLSFGDLIITVLAQRHDATSSPSADDVLSAAEDYVAAMDAIERQQAEGEISSFATGVAARRAETQWRSAINPDDIAAMLRELLELRQEAENNKDYVRAGEMAARFNPYDR